jgi:hypothetical protein
MKKKPVTVPFPDDIQVTQVIGGYAASQKVKDGLMA